MQSCDGAAAGHGHLEPEGAIVLQGCQLRQRVRVVVEGHAPHHPHAVWVMYCQVETPACMAVHPGLAISPHHGLCAGLMLPVQEFTNHVSCIRGKGWFADTALLLRP